MSWYKKAKSEIPVISFDFDSTIFMPDYEADPFGGIGTLNQNIKRKMDAYSASGAKIIIVTSRMEGTKPEVEDFVGKENLPVSEIHCTNSRDKIDTLKELSKRMNIIKHYDDDQVELDLIASDPDCEIEAVAV
jgi:uncharacterized HAD superfamily protein